MKPKKLIEVYSFKAGCCVVDGKIITVLGGYALTSSGKKYIKTQSAEQTKYLSIKIKVAKKFGSTVRITGQELEGIIHLKTVAATVNKHINTKKLLARNEMESLATPENPVSTGHRRSWDRVDDKVSRKLGTGTPVISLGIKSGTNIDISDKAFGLYPLPPHEYFSISLMNRAQKLHHMKLLIKKYPEVAKQHGHWVARRGS